MRKYAFPKFAATSFFVLSILFSCDKEENQLLDLVQGAETSNIIVEQVDFNAIPELSKALTDSSGKSVLPKSYSGKEGSSFWIDESDVLKLKDSVQNESYSIIIHSDDPSPTKLYNLVVTKRTDGDPIPPFVVEYNFEALDRSGFAEDDEKHFEGTLNIYALSEFAKITGLNAKDDDPVICFQDVGVRDNTSAENNASSSSSGTSGGSTAGSSNSSGPSAIVTRTHISVNNNFQSTGVSVGIGTFYMSRPINTNEDYQDQKTHITGKEKPNDCPEGWVSVPINEIEEDRLEDNTDNPCVKKILQKLQQKDMQNLTVPDIGHLSGTGHLSQGILDLFDSSGNYNLVFKVAEAGYSNGNPRNAHTKKTNGKREWTITLDDDYVKNATQLAVARTIIHESVHAFLGYNLDANPNSDLSTLMRDYYVGLGSQQTLSSGVKVNLTHHQFIGQYVQGIAKSLSAWDNGQQPQSYYEKLAWGGLETSSAFNSLSSNLKDSIRKILNNEQTANNHAKGKKCP
ncbi:MAG: hypothetical protein RIM83_14580 [Allomuricauda sp.]